MNEMEVEDVRTDLKFDARHIWNSRERVTVRAMDDNLAKVSEEILVEDRGKEAYLLCPTDVAGVVDVSAENACDQEGRRRLVFVKSKTGNLVAGTRQCATMRARTEADCQELQVIIEHMNMKHKELLATMERTQKLMSGTSEDHREQL